MRKSTFLLAVVFLMTPFVFSGCVCDGEECSFVFSGNDINGSGNVVEEERPIENVRSVEFGYKGEVFIDFGDQERLVVEAEDNLLEHLRTTIRGDTLTIDKSPGSPDLDNTRPILFHVTLRKLEQLTVNSSGSIFVEGVEAGTFEVAIHSSGTIEVDELVADRLSVEISSSGDVSIGQGDVRALEVHISSSGNFKAPDLTSQTADVTITSSGSAEIHVSERLAGRLSSSGGILYSGNPTVDVRTTSSGRVRKAGG